MPAASDTLCWRSLHRNSTGTCLREETPAAAQASALQPRVRWRRPCRPPAGPGSLRRLLFPLPWQNRCELTRWNSWTECSAGAKETRRPSDGRPFLRAGDFLSPRCVTSTRADRLRFRICKCERVVRALSPETRQEKSSLRTELGVAAPGPAFSFAIPPLGVPTAGESGGSHW